MARTKRFNPRYRENDEPQPAYKPRKPKKRYARPVSIRELDYQAYCRAPHYIELKARIFAERGGCEVCGTNKKLSLHHLRYTYRGQSVLWQERDEDVMVMCWPCHQAWERYCKGQQLNEDVRDRLRRLWGMGLEREVVFPAAVATNYQELVEGYERDVAERMFKRSAWIGLQYAVNELKQRSGGNSDSVVVY